LADRFADRRRQTQLHKTNPAIFQTLGLLFLRCEIKASGKGSNKEDLEISFKAAAAAAAFPFHFAQHPR
jgi:hypothetical protein